MILSIQLKNCDPQLRSSILYIMGWNTMHTHSFTLNVFGVYILDYKVAHNVYHERCS